LRTVPELFVRVADRQEAGLAQVQFLATVALDLRGAAVVAVTVELDGDALLAEQRIDLPPCDPLVQFGELDPS
jgi:hypothetical protein